MLVEKALRKISPETRVSISCWLLLICIITWPVTSFTVFSEEPQGILGLSWLALIFTCVDIVVTTDVRQEQDNDTDEIKETCPGCGK